VVRYSLVGNKDKMNTDASYSFLAISAPKAPPPTRQLINPRLKTRFAIISKMGMVGKKKKFKGRRSTQAHHPNHTTNVFQYRHITVKISLQSEASLKKLSSLLKVPPAS
jgi:hypothetical protein